LYLDNIPSSFLIGFVYNKSFILGSLGFDPEIKYYHPGMFLFMKMIEESCRDINIEAIDFGFGDADYKQKYGEECWQESNVFIFANTLRGLQLNAMKNLMAGISHSAIKILDRLKMLDLVKRKWRHRLASPVV
jgi:CelD/BcsL family acetyltransferase involved in cellulose biosynthesis